MAKSHGSLFSTSAHGSISKMLTYSKRKSGQQVRGYNKPQKTATPAQRSQRRLTEFLVAQWQHMSDVDKATWATNAAASEFKLSGYHYFLREAQRDLYTHHGLCGYWSFNKIINGTVRDWSGNGNTGILKPTYPSNSPLPVNSYKTRDNKALSFDGLDYVQCGNSKKFDLPVTGSVGCLVYARTHFQDTFVCKPGSGNAGDNYWLVIGSAKNLLFMVREGSSTCSIGMTGDFPLKQFTWITGTFDANWIRLYANGVEIATPVAMTVNPTIYTNDVAIGKRYTTNNYPANAIIDEVTIYNRALPATEIATRYKFATAKV